MTAASAGPLRPGYKLTEVGVIPEEWNVKYLEDLTDPMRPISYGIVQTGPDLPNGVACLRVVDINNGSITKSDLIRTSKQISDAYRRTMLKAGDLVMPLRGKVGDVGAVDLELEGANLTRGVALLAIRATNSAQFCRHFISWPSTRRRLEQSMNGSALQEIPIAALRSFQIAIPKSEVEQRAIADMLGDVDALLGGLDRLIAKKRDLMQAAMQQLLTGRTRLPGFHAEWTAKRLGELAEIVSGGTPRTSETGYWNGSVKWCTPTDITGCEGKYLIDTARSISRLGLKSCGARLLPPGALLLCSRATVAALEVAAPSLKEQVSIAAVLSEMDSELSSLEARRTKTRALKQAMMQELLTGRIRLA